MNAKIHTTPAKAQASKTSKPQMKSASDWLIIYSQIQREYPNRPPGTLRIWIEQIQQDAISNSTEHAALMSVAEAAKYINNSAGINTGFTTTGKLNRALTNLAAVQKGGGL